MTVAAIDFPVTAHRARPGAMALWLFAVAALVFAMVVVGGITRLTESGLSMVKWEPVSGIVPPLTTADWQAEFSAYKATPQYTKVNRGMALGDFQNIFFWEYVHRALARFIGVAFAVPLAWFAWRRAIPAGYGPRLVGILGLGALQGGIGWWMVASGLVNEPAVAHQRLATHLVMALLIMSVSIWTALDFRLLAQPEPVTVRRPTSWIVPFLVLLGLQIILGAFVAGLRAGYAFNTWPLMGDSFAPPGLDSLAPHWRNAIDNPVAVQFIHRCTAYLVALYALRVAWRLRSAGPGGGVRAGAMALMVVVQVALGILTIIHGVPIPLAVAHQAGAALLLTITIWTAHWCWQGRGKTA